MSNYRAEKSLEARQKECAAMKIRYPDRVCVYLSRNPNCITVPDIEKNKFLVPGDVTMSQFMTIVRKRIDIKQCDSIFIFTEHNTIPRSSDTMQSIYNYYHNIDGFLYMTYSSESTFG